MPTTLRKRLALVTALAAVKVLALALPAAAGVGTSPM